LAEISKTVIERRSRLKGGLTGKRQIVRRPSNTEREYPNNRHALLGAEGPSVRKRTLAYCTQCRWVALAALTTLSVAGAVEGRCVYCTQSHPPR
jgi:hypothetical protein